MNPKKICSLRTELNASKIQQLIFLNGAELGVEEHLWKIENNDKNLKGFSFQIAFHISLTFYSTLNRLKLNVNSIMSVFNVKKKTQNYNQSTHIQRKEFCPVPKDW